MAVRPFTRYRYSTNELISRFKPSLSNTFDVFVNTAAIDGGFDWRKDSVDFDDIHFMAYEAALPGTSYELGSVYGQRQGRTEYYPGRRVYPPVDVSFYIDKDYKVLRFFECWMNTASNNMGETQDSYVQHKYPNQYKGEVTIAKYERDFLPSSRRLSPDNGGHRPGSVLKYTLRKAFPSNLISVPVSYEGATILKTTVTFQYDVYHFETNQRPIENVIPNKPGGSAQQPVDQGDPGDIPNFLGNTPNELAELQREAFQKSIRASGKSGSQFRSETAQQIINQDVYKGLNLDQK